MFDTARMALIPIVLSHCKSTKPKNHTSTLSITYFCTTEYLVRIKVNCAWSADNFPPLDMAFLPTVLQYNKPKKSKNHPSAFVYYFLFIKWNFVFTLRNSGQAKTRPTGPVPTPLTQIIFGIYPISTRRNRSHLNHQQTNVSDAPSTSDYTSDTQKQS